MAGASCYSVQWRSMFNCPSGYCLWWVPPRGPCFALRSPLLVRSRSLCLTSTTLRGINTCVNTVGVSVYVGYVTLWGYPYIGVPMQGGPCVGTCVCRYVCM